MAPCLHLEIEVNEELEGGMHCSGWLCRSCAYLAIGECHHQSWCRTDFCGVEPVVVEVPRELVFRL